MKELRAAGAEVLVVGGGNLFFYRRQLRELETEQLLFKARVIVDAYNEIGVGALALGPYDFAAGLEVVRALERVAQFPFLCANLLDRASGQPLFRPHAVVEAGGRRVGLIGVLDSASPVEGLEPLRHAVRIDSLYTTVKRCAAELRDAGCDLVLVLSSADPKKFRLLAKNIPEVDAYLVGSPDDKLRIPWEIGGALVASTTQLGKYLGHLRVSAAGSGEPGLRNSFEPMHPEDPDEPAVKRLVDSYYAHAAMVRLQEPERYVQEEEERVNLRQGRPLYVSARRCGECHPAQVEGWNATPHARAFAALSARDRERAECVECHVTGFGAPGGYQAGSDPDLRGVQCEACHGPGSLHPAVAPTRTGKGLAKACPECHTRSRSPDFNLAAAWSQVACVCAPQRGGVSGSRP